MEGLDPAQTPWWGCHSWVEAVLQKAFTYPLPPRTPRVLPPEPPQWDLPGPGHTVPTMWGAGRLCPWPDPFVEREECVQLPAGSGKMGHCHPHRARPGQEGCVVVPSGELISLCQCLWNQHTLPALLGTAVSWSSRDSVRDGIGPPGEESTCLCFALIDHLKKFYIYIYINI